MRDYSANLKLLGRKVGGEGWKKSKAFPDYAASNHGRAMRITRGGSNAAKPGKMLRVTNTSYMGYVRLALYKNQKISYVGLHRFVLETFKGSAPTAQHVAAHWDNNKKNNHLSNLRWATHLENAADRVRHGTVPRGVHHKNAAFTEKQIRALRKLSSRGIGFAVLADATGVGPSTMGRIVRGETYKW